ncbi:MAG: GFA family protein [Candidatus Binataceae bacterium]
MASYEAAVNGQCLRRHFCPGCGSAVSITLDRYPEIRSMMGGTLDDRDKINPISASGAPADSDGSNCRRVLPAIQNIQTEHLAVNDRRWLLCGTPATSNTHTIATAAGLQNRTK